MVAGRDPLDWYPLRQEHDFALDENFLNYLGMVQPDVVFLCNPNNPTGRIIPYPLLQQILHFCKEKHIRLFVDKCFLDLSDDGISLKTYLSECLELCILKAFTKSYGMAGVRLGYCLCSDSELLTEMSQTVQPWNVSLLAQAAGTAALRETAFLQKTRSLIQTECKWLKQELEALGFWVCPSKVNFLLFQAPSELHTALKAEGIAIRSCDNYHGLKEGWYRIAVRLHEQNIKLIAAMQSVVEKE